MINKTPLPIPTYRDMLQKEMVSRLARNASYSIRAFARDLDISSSYLSQILNKKRNLNEDRAYKISRQLNWSEDQTKTFINLIRYEKTTSPTHRKQILAEINPSSAEFFVLETELFETMASWQYFAIIELTTLSSEKMTAKKIARRLDLPTIECNQMLDRLLRLKMLEKVGNNYQKTEVNYACEEDIHLEAGKQYHKKIFEHAKKSLYQENPKEREFRSLVVATDLKKIPEIKRRIRAFEDDLMNFMEDGDRTSIYQLSSQFFRMDKEL